MASSPVRPVFLEIQHALAQAKRRNTPAAKFELKTHFFEKTAPHIQMLAECVVSHVKANLAGTDEHTIATMNEITQLLELCIEVKKVMKQ